MWATVVAGTVEMFRIAQSDTEESWGCGLTCSSTSSVVSVVAVGEGVSEGNVTTQL